MKRPEPESPDAKRRACAASAWLVKHDRGLTPAEQDEFLQWLAADPRHGEWFALHRRMVGDFGGLVQRRPEHSEKPNPILPARPRPPLRWFAPVALAAAASIAVVFVWWRIATPAHDRELTQVGGYERRILEDGSMVELNRGAVVTVAFTAGERRVALVHGEALFTVAKNPARPFIVRAGGVDVRAVGTAFNVSLGAAAVEVLVTEGCVALAKVERADSNALTEGDPARRGQHAPRAEPPLVVAGQRATVSLATAAPPQIVAVTVEASARLLAWQPQLLDFSSVPLTRAIAEFNRRNRVQFVLADPELGAMRIVASIRSDNIEGFAQFLAAAPSVQVERRGETEIVLRRKK
jgi:transmembrane sensor